MLRVARLHAAFAPLVLTLATFATSAASAANVAPELYLPLPAGTLASGAISAPLTLADHLRDPDVPGTAVRLNVRLGSQTADLYLALFDSAAPLTVANFRNYITSGAFSSNFFHRSIPGFILQTGGFRFLNDTTYEAIATFPPVPNEFGASNLRGTIAMAKLPGDPDSATSGWFINLADNSANLDFQNGGFTVFGRVLGNGMTGIVDVLATVPTYDATFQDPAWSDLPLISASLSRFNFLESSAFLVSPLSYQVSSDNPSLVTATVTDGILQLAASTTAAGQTTIRITSTDLEGATLASSFPVTVLSSDPLVAWRQTRFSTTDNTGPAANLADPDGDGIPNLLEYALGGDPLSAASAPSPVLQVSGLSPQPAFLTLTYKRAASGLTYEVQTTTDLANPASWTTTGVTEGTPDVNGLTTATIPFGASPRFLRLSVSITP